MTRKLIPLIALLAMFCFIFSFSYNSHAGAKSVTISWSASSTGNVTGYQVNYGLTSGNYTKTIDAGNALSITIPIGTGENELTKDLYYFSVQAYNQYGDISASGGECSVDLRVPGTPGACSTVVNME